MKLYKYILLFALIAPNGMSDGSNPLVGSEQDLTISLNYKF